MIEGNWSVRYSQSQESPFVSEDGDIEERGRVTLSNGEIVGNDPFGGQYKGKYQLDGEKLTASVNVICNEDDSEPIFEGVTFPFNLNLEGNFSSPNYFSMTGTVVESPEHKIVLNCQRI